MQVRNQRIETFNEIITTTDIVAGRILSYYMILCILWLESRMPLNSVH